MRNRMTRLVSALLVFAMLLSSVSLTAFADFSEASATESRVVTATNIGRSDREMAHSERDFTPEKLYSDDEIVNVVIQLEKPSVLEHYNSDPMPMAIDAEDAAGGGKALSAYLTSATADRIADDLLSDQQNVIAQINSLPAFNAGADVPMTVSALQTSNSNVEILYQFTSLFNGMTAKMPYGMLESVKALPGVKRAFVQDTYSIPEPPKTNVDAGTASYSYDMVDLDAAWAEGITGKGLVVAILDTGLDIEYAGFSVTEPNGDYENVYDIRHTHEAFTDESFASDNPLEFVAYNRTSMTRFLEGGDLVASMMKPNTESAMYYNLKVPFAFDYHDYDNNVHGDVESAGEADHGTHVAGTIAGYAETDDGAVKFSGIAPDAQLLIMKVFGDDGIMMEDVILYALNDAMLLGADVINMSLGSDNGFAEDDTFMHEVYAELEAAGITLAVSAGNSGSAASNSANGDGSYGITDGVYGYNLAANPENSMLGSPASYDSVMAVASINNSISGAYAISWSDNGKEDYFEYTNVAIDGIAYPSFIENFADEIPGGGVIYDAGHGLDSEYRQASNSGNTIGFALVERGGTDSSGEVLSFETKLRNSMAYGPRNSHGITGIQGVIVYDNVPGESLINMSVPSDVTMPAIFISYEDGHKILDAIKAGHEVKLTNVEGEMRIVAGPSDDELVDLADTNADLPGKMSSYSSWGATPSLTLKPDITAPGGNIWSSLFDTSYNYNTPGYHDDYTGAYGFMSGTSMAAPHIAGISALVQQHVAEAFPRVSSMERAFIAEHLMASTAVPQTDVYGDFVSPRWQGAGLVNVESAISSPVFVDVRDEDGMNKKIGKLELLDDPDGEFDFSLYLMNLSNKAVTYKATAHYLIPQFIPLDDDGTEFAFGDFDLEIGDKDLGTVTVNGYGDSQICGEQVLSGKLSIADTELTASQIKRIFPNGTYLEGYILLEDPTGVNPTLSVPFLGFIGDWTEAPIFDASTWLDFKDENGAATETAYNTTYGTSSLGYFDGASFYDLGGNPYDTLFQQAQLGYEARYLEENITLSDYIVGINDFTLYQLRDARVIIMVARDKETGEYYDAVALGCVPKTVLTYMGSVGYVPYPMMANLNYSWNGTYVDDEGNDIPLPDGTEVEYSIYAFNDGDYNTYYDEEYEEYVIDVDSIDFDDPSTFPTFNGHEMSMKGDVISFDVLIDRTAPELVGNSVSVTGKDGELPTVSGKFTDAGSIAYFAVYPEVNIVDKETGEVVESFYATMVPFEDELIFDADVGEYEFATQIDYSAIADDIAYGYGYGQYPYSSYNYEWSGNVVVHCGDYGFNENMYLVGIEGNTAEGELIIAPSVIAAYPGEEFDLAVIDNTGVEGTITYTSDNPEVATVDENGHIVAVSVGQALITVEKGGVTAVCVVNVMDEPEGVNDFELSIYDYETLFPSNYLDIAVVSCEPAGASIGPDDITWNIRGAEAAPYGSAFYIYDENGNQLLYVNLTQSDRDPTVRTLSYYYHGSEYNTPPSPTEGTIYVDVTVGDVTKTCEVKWQNKNYSDDYIIADSGYSPNAAEFIYLNETVELGAAYYNTTAHNVIEVELYAPDNAPAYSYGYDHQYDPAVGLVLDGDTWTTSNGEWHGFIKSTDGYTLPAKEDILVGYKLESGYEYYYTNSWRTEYEYDPVTGQIDIFSGTYAGSLVIRANGVEAPGTPAMELIGPSTMERPKDVDGPFIWSIVKGTGSLADAAAAEPAAIFNGFMPMNNGIMPIAADNTVLAKRVIYTPVEPGLAIVRATDTTDPTLYYNIAVYTRPIPALGIEVVAVSENAELATQTKIYMDASEDDQLYIKADVLPVTSGLGCVMTSLTEDVLKMNPDGTFTALKNGTALVKIAVEGDPNLFIIVQVEVSGIVEVEVLPSTGNVTVGPDGSATVDASKSSIFSIKITPPMLAVGAKYESSDPGIVIVNDDGTFTALKNGTVTITITLENGEVIEVPVTITGISEAPSVTPVVPNFHNHSYVLRSNAEGHWYECFFCGSTTALTPHNYVNGVCTVCGVPAPAETEDVVEVEAPTEAPETQEDDEEGGDMVVDDEEPSEDENPKTGVVFPVAAIVMMTAAAAISKKR